MSSTPSTSNLNADLNQPSNNKRKTHAHNALKTWKNPTVEHNYASNLISALCKIRKPYGGRAVRETADKVLAVTARGKTRWSRAILTSRLSSRLCHINRLHKRAKPRNVKPRTGSKRNKPGLKKSEPGLKKNEPGLKRKVCLLGKLVPGCNKVSFSKLLEESSDYIAALQMQVRAMSVLTEVLCGGASSSQPLV